MTKIHEKNLYQSKLSGIRQKRPSMETTDMKYLPPFIFGATFKDCSSFSGTTFKGKNWLTLTANFFL